MDAGQQGAVSTHECSGTVIGNVYDKYRTRNPIARFLMRGFLGAVAELYAQVRPESVLEVGCGEGHLSNWLIRQGPPVRRFEACDLTLKKIASGINPLIKFHTASIYDLPFREGEFELVVCCEVLEHLENPQRAFSELRRVSSRAILVSTPREPLWRILNMLRGAYPRQFGNTPGHVQHFSRKALIELASRYCRIVEERHPLPWTVLLGEPFGDKSRSGYGR